jgi:hypothetical protein
MLQTKSLKRRLVIAFMAISLVFTMATLVRGQPSKVRVGVFTPGISLEDVRDGLQQGLTRLGYLEAKNITFIAKKLDVRLFRRDVTNEQEIRDALEETSKGSVDAIFHVASTLVRTHIEFLIKRRRLTKSLWPFTTMLYSIGELWFLTARILCSSDSRRPRSSTKS